MKINPNSPKYQASIRRWNTYQARKRLERKVQTCFAPDSRFYTLPLDLHRFKLTPDLLFWHWRAAFIAPLRERLSQYAPPLPLRYVYALDLHTYTRLCSICSQTRRTPPYKPRLRTYGYMAITAVWSA